jgi:hypothetical protein
VRHAPVAGAALLALLHLPLLADLGSTSYALAAQPPSEQWPTYLSDWLLPALHVVHAVIAYSFWLEELALGDFLTAIKKDQ